MDEDLEIIEGEATDLDAPADAEASIPDERKATAIWQHPLRKAIEHLLAAGKSARWIRLYLEEEFPDPPDVDDEDFDDPDYEDPGYTAAQAARWRLTEETINAYRERWMPECVPGVDVVNEEIHDFVQRRLPASVGVPFEVEILELAIDVAQHNLALSLRVDKGMQMLTPTTLDANDRMIAAAVKSAELKSRLGHRGYEVVPERHEANVKVESRTTNTNRNVHLHGHVRPDGSIEPGEPEKFKLLRKLVDASPEERRQIMAASEAVEPEAPAADGDA